MYRKRRIAVSVFCGVVCLLLVALWVRSYWRDDAFRAPLPTPYVLLINSDAGRIVFQPHDTSPYPHIRGWSYDSADRTLRPSYLGPAYPLYWTEVRPYNALVISHWFAVVVATTLAAVPWMRWRFGLRTMLIVMTLVAVLIATMPHVVPLNV